MATDAKTRIRSYYERLWNSGDQSVIDEMCQTQFTDHWHEQSGTTAWKAAAAELRRTFFRLAPTGKAAEFSGVFIDRLDGDRIAEHWAVSDMWRIMRHLEIVPASWQADSMLVAVEDT